MLRAWNVSLICATFALSLLGHVPRPLGGAAVDPRLRRVEGGAPLLALIAVVVVGSTILIVSRLDSLRSERRLDSLLQPRVGLPRQQPAARRPRRGGRLGHVLPADLGGGRPGRRSSLGRAVVQPRTRRRWRSCSSSSWASGRWWRGAGSPGGLRRALAIPLAATAAAAVALALIGDRDAPESPTAYALFLVAHVHDRRDRAGDRRGGLGARRALAGGGRLAALGALVTRNRRRYGGYIVHVGLVLALFGIAASSSFQTSRDLRLQPGRQRRGRRLHRHLRASRPATRPPVRARSSRSLRRGRSSVTRDGEHVATLEPSREYYSPDRATRRRRSAASSRARRRARSGASEGLGARPLERDAARPELLRRRDRALRQPLRRLPRGRSRRGPRAIPRAGAAGERRRARRSTRSSSATSTDTPPAEIRFNVNPFVVWFWIGVLVGVGGALFALWPAAEGRRRRVTDVYGARLARELGCATRYRGAPVEVADRDPDRRAGRGFRRGTAARLGLAGAGREDPRLADLEARKQAKYREIRDTELDHAQGKLSDEEFARQDAELRREAIEILESIDETRPADPAASEQRLTTLRARGNAPRHRPGRHLDHPGLARPAPLGQGRGPLGRVRRSAAAAARFGGGSLVERNLDRWTIFFAVLFVAQHDRPAQDLSPAAPVARPRSPHAGRARRGLRRRRGADARRSAARLSGERRDARLRDSDHVHELDPLLASSTDEQLVTRQIHEPLVASLRRPSATRAARAGSRISWRSTPDREIWSFQLRKGIRFQDGLPLNASAVLANAERWRTLPEGGR